MRIELCPACGNQHDTSLPPGSAGTILAATRARSCPGLPEHWLWLSKSFPVGPNDVIIDLKAL